MQMLLAGVNRIFFWGGGGEGEENGNVQKHGSKSTPILLAFSMIVTLHTWIQLNLCRGCLTNTVLYWDVPSSPLCQTREGQGLALPIELPTFPSTCRHSAPTNVCPRLTHSKYFVWSVILRIFQCSTSVLNYCSPEPGILLQIF